MNAKQLAAQKHTRWRERLDPRELRNLDAQGYERADQRPRCEACAHFRTNFDDPDFGTRHNRTVVQTCAIGGFPVNRLGICTKFERATT
jgi:hypothetical protein